MRILEHLRVTVDGPARNFRSLEPLQPVTTLARHCNALDDVLQELLIGYTIGIGFKLRVIQKRLQPHDLTEAFPEMRAIGGDGNITILHTEGAMWRVAAVRRPERHGELAAG